MIINEDKINNLLNEVFSSKDPNLKSAWAQAMDIKESSAELVVEDMVGFSLSDVQSLIRLAEDLDNGSINESDIDEGSLLLVEEYENNKMAIHEQIIEDGLDILEIYEALINIDDLLIESETLKESNDDGAMTPSQYTFFEEYLENLNTYINESNIDEILNEEELIELDTIIEGLLGKIKKALSGTTGYKRQDLQRARAQRRADVGSGLKSKRLTGDLASRLGVNQPRTGPQRGDSAKRTAARQATTINTTRAVNKPDEQPQNKPQQEPQDQPQQEPQDQPQQEPQDQPQQEPQDQPKGKKGKKGKKRLTPEEIAQKRKEGEATRQARAERDKEDASKMSVTRTTAGAFDTSNLNTKEKAEKTMKAAKSTSSRISTDAAKKTLKAPGDSDIETVSKARSTVQRKAKADDIAARAGGTKGEREAAAANLAKTTKERDSTRVERDKQRRALNSTKNLKGQEGATVSNDTTGASVQGQENRRAQRAASRNRGDAPTVVKPKNTAPPPKAAVANESRMQRALRRFLS